MSRFRFRRTAHKDPEETGSGGADEHASAGYLATASRLHSFNRYEIKYLIDEWDVPALREALATQMDIDPYSPIGGYPVTSLYYDTQSLRFYWEKIEGLKFRRKLRMRLYGAPSECTADTPVQVEIKQRVNRVTQKRRIALSYGDACRWLHDGEDLDWSPRQRAFAEEVTMLIGDLDLRPIVTTGYLREAFIGRDADVGLRVTIDHKVHGRDRDFAFASGGENRFIIPPHLAIVELKANERVPYWTTDLTARLNMSVVRVSKYCQSVEGFGLAPRSILGPPELIASDGESAVVSSELLEDATSVPAS
ncbi:polyphosphate polymerase domain-containing protein [Gordonia sp. HY002]|uniref:polyphosphate polymerase domain-containing protein n=1 Tax=Gordonia zhenghanii TaxID=2911516 RepID=UPI001EEF90E3|nr:polyphosphate polymerase domain-containing protein [Gordonia zhenghanii]MCF8571669.1 polyphosphate polymerase domain-containing protein [Gordonia zhenghanii]MCF8602692.1 polyphosphate polymerase domain-containing protein [Gordonia zhenghanii]